MRRDFTGIPSDFYDIKSRNFTRMRSQIGKKKNVLIILDLSLILSGFNVEIVRKYSQIFGDKNV